MRVFKIEKNNLISFREVDFKMDNVEKILEDWIENNPSSIFEDEEVYIIGRQVTTNLNKSIDLLGLDKTGNIVVIELKRGKTPRETVAQILEYASFVEDLTYQNLEEIAIQYRIDEGLNLTERHKEFFGLNDETAVAFNKEQRLVIIGQDISKEVEQTSIFLNKKGLNIYCIAFKYFKNETGEKIISSDIIVKKDKQISVSPINPKIFLENVNEYIRDFFSKLFTLASENNMPLHWGSTGFSLNVDLNGNHVNILYGYSNKAVGGQSIYTAVMEIKRKANNAEEIIKKYFENLNSTGLFEPAANEIKWIINKPISEEKVKIIFDSILLVKDRIETGGLVK
jgi:RecB family endonuclease NucS